MFGGVVDERNISRELWYLNMVSGRWYLQDHLEQLGDMDYPYAVAGHSAHVLNDYMIVLFGYNIFHGYLHKVQRYSFANKKWTIDPTRGAHVIGSFGHSSTLVRERKGTFIYVYGGYHAPQKSVSYAISDRLYRYDIVNKSWKELGHSGFQSFRNAMVAVNGILLIVGGNAHNESTPNRLTECYSKKMLAFDTVCGKWIDMDVEASLAYLNPSLNRYGHTASFVNGRVYVIGGFNGQMLGDVVRFVPAVCNGFGSKDRSQCWAANQGIKCEFNVQENACRPLGTPNAKIVHQIGKIETHLQYASACPLTDHSPSERCTSLHDCQSCTSKGCIWCHDTCHTTCHPQEGEAISEVSSCSELKRPCSMLLECAACREIADCRWHWTETRSLCITASEQEQLSSHKNIEGENDDTMNIALSMSVANVSCPVPCAFHTLCSACINAHCMWCSSTRRCVSMDSYMISFPYGQCSSWISRTVEENACMLDPSNCSLHETCAQCQKVGPGCGWCDDGSGTGVGRCMEGGLKASLCFPSSRWYFVGCPACQCNGHSKCSTSRQKSTISLAPRKPSLTGTQKCHTPCANNTFGEHCEMCIDGYFGNALNGGTCSPCQCNYQAESCDRYSGHCYCMTKGVSGSHCDKCEQKYLGDPKSNQSCFYVLPVDFIFTFNLDGQDPKDKYVNSINFFNRPHKEETDVTLGIACAKGTAKVNLSMLSERFSNYANKERRFLANEPCDRRGIKRTFSTSEPDFHFGTDDNTTFLVYVHNFSTPIKITISFAQTPPINWLLFFVIFAACFVVLLVVAGLLWMVKLRINVYRRRQRLFVEIEQMASRPFAAVRLQVAKSSRVQLTGASVISVEPCSNYRAAVITVAVRLPTGRRKYTPQGTSGLAVASSLCFLTTTQTAILQTPPSPDPNQKRKNRLRTFCILPTS